MTGYDDQCDSTNMNKIPQAALAMNSPHIKGCDQGNSSVDFRLKPRRRHPMNPTSVKEPRKSIRRSFSTMLWVSNEEGSSIFTLTATKRNDSNRIGVCSEAVKLYSEHPRATWQTWNRNAARLIRHLSSEHAREWTSYLPPKRVIYPTSNRTTKSGTQSKQTAKSQ